MNSKFFKVIFAAVFSIGLTSQANANVLYSDTIGAFNSGYFQVGESYNDASTLSNEGTWWEYVGFFDIRTGIPGVDDDAQEFTSEPIAYNGLEAARLIFGQPTDSLMDFAVSAFTYDSDSDIAITALQLATNLGVVEGELEDVAAITNLAWYDTFDDRDAPEIGLFIASESIINVGGISGNYDENDNTSAFVGDRAFGGVNKNYVFRRITEVPEPSAIAIFILVLCTLGASKLKR